MIGASGRANSSSGCVAKSRSNTDNVGARFPQVARAIHLGEEPERGIRGRASLAEAKSLLEDGIGVLPLPMLEDELN